jgi:hypothetical protein
MRQRKALSGEELLTPRYQSIFIAMDTFNMCKPSCESVWERFDPRHDGRLMKEWVAVESTSEEEWLSLAREAMEFVASKS